MTIERHEIVVHLGSTDRKGTAARSGWKRTLLDFSPDGRLVHGIGATIDSLGKIGLEPSQVGIDVAVLAAAVYAADTRIERSDQSQDGWTRELAIRVPVSSPDQWTPHADLIARTLRFLTGDVWDVRFRRRPKALAKIAPAKVCEPIVPREFDRVSLFSGGLDSLIGAIDVLANGDPTLLVSHAADGPTSTAQNACFEVLSDAYSTVSPTRLRAWVQFDHKLFSGASDEKTTRGRSFLFLALAVLAGSAFGKRFSLLVPENGFISLNVPLEPTRVGALSTRTTHPFYLARWQELLDGLSIDAEIRNPYQFQTKGEMVQACVDQAVLRKALPVSMSCSSPAKVRWKKMSPRHCGYCVPCLIRRAAIETAWGSDPTEYAVDVKLAPLDVEKAEGADAHAFQYAVSHLASHPESARALVRKSGPLTDCLDSVVELAGVYRRGLEEVGQLVGPLS